MVEIFVDPRNGNAFIQEETLNITLEDADLDSLLVHALVTGILCCCSLALHVFAMIVLISERKRLDKGDVFIFTLFFANTLQLVFHSSTIPIASIVKKWPFGEICCALTGFVYLMSTDLRQLSLVALSIHRYCNVRFPFRYAAKSTRVLVSMMVAIALYMIIGHTGFVLNSVVFFDVTWPTCETAGKPDIPRVIQVFLGLVRIAVILLGITPFVLYVLMKVTAMKIEKRSSYQVYRKRTAKIFFIQSTLDIEKKAQFVVVALLFAGLPNTAIVFTKKFSNVITFGLDNVFERLNLHFLLTDIVLVTPYLDLFVMMSAKEKRKATKNLLKKALRLLKVSKTLSLF